MRESSFWFGIRRSLFAPEIVWIVWWGLWIMGVVNIWWVNISNLLLYAWYILIIIAGIIYSISWNTRNLVLTVGINLSVMLVSIYLFQLYYYASMPAISDIEQSIIFSVIFAIPILILFGYLWRLLQVYKGKQD